MFNISVYGSQHILANIDMKACMFKHLWIWEPVCLNIYIWEPVCLYIYVYRSQYILTSMDTGPSIF